MIKSLQIDNIALIDHCEISFENGLTVFSGETGSGKSIIIDSLAFVLGDRADKTLIKYGQDVAEVTALFDVEADCPVLDKLEEYGFGRDTEIIINRKMSIAGKNEIRIQGKTTTLAILKEVCSELVDIFGQGQHLAMLNEKNQLTLLDAFCRFNGVDTKLKDEMYPQLTAINRELKSFGGSDFERERMLDMLKYQIDELENANLDENEEEELLQMHKRMVNVEKIASALNEVVNVLGGDSGAISTISVADSQLKSIINAEDNAEGLSERLTSVKYEVQDICSCAEDILSKTDFSPSEVDKMESRLEQIKQIKRKYGGTIADALAFLEDAKEKYQTLANSAERIQELNTQKMALLNKMYGVACDKHDIRCETANKLSQQIMSELCDLGMKGTHFEVSFNPVPTFDDYCQGVSADGFDKVEFLMSANIGEPLKPLSKVISGGEMSRFMLAVKNITALAEKIPTMVFDEIDTGISGNMAQMVANKLANIATSDTAGYQCIVITHLPQIVAMADTNIFVQKFVSDDKTHTSVKILDDIEQKSNEVARLMGSTSLSGLATARELIEKSQNYKQQKE